MKQENSTYPEFYVYDSNGRLNIVAKLVTFTFSDNSTITVMYPITQYIWGPDRVLAKIEPIANKSYYYLYNGHGDVVQIVDTAGNIANQYDYDAWGNFLTKQETIDNHFTYFGQTYDETTGLYYLRARYYDPTTGRFTQQDPAEDGYNWYVYGNQNPIVFVDPEGKASFREKWDALWQVGPFDASSINNIGNSTLKAAQVYATEKGLSSVTDNVADAYRHFAWNYESVKSGISVKDVMQATTNHEVLTQVYMGKDSSGTKYYKVALSSLMDLQNNKAGRYQATLNSNNNKTSREVFDRLALYGGVVTSLEQVKSVWGIKDDWIYPDSEGVRGEMSVLIKNGLVENALSIIAVDRNKIKFK